MAGLQEQLLDMGFELERAQLAAQSARNISEAIDLMETYQDRPLADLQAAVAASAKTAAVADPEEAGTAMTGTTAADPAVSSVMCEQCTAAAASAPSRLSGPSGGAVEPGPVTVRRPTSDAEAAGWADPSKAPESAYLKLQLVSATAQAALPPLDQATAVTCLASALQPHESSTGTTVSPELLKLDPETQTFWLRVPHADADGVVWALSSWAGTGSGDEDTGDAGVAFRVIERGCHLNPQVTALADAVRPATPLTAEEKAAKLAELRQRMEAKRALKSQQQKAEDRRNEEIRRKATKESANIKEDLQRRERLKEAEAKKREKREEAAAKARIKAKIEADKQARRERAELERARRAGQVEPGAAPSTAATTTTTTTPTATTSPAGSTPQQHTQARLRLQTATGSLIKAFPAETTLFEVAAAVEQETGVAVASFTQNFPRKVYNQEFFGDSLRELGMVPSASLVVQ